VAEVIAKELQAAGAEGAEEPHQEQPSKEPREHADRRRSGPAGDPPLAIERDAAAGHDNVCVRVWVSDHSVDAAIAWVDAGAHHLDREDIPLLTARGRMLTEDMGNVRPIPPSDL
jgi:hypothetical protein